jgi:hypothetical protein
VDKWALVQAHDGDDIADLKLVGPFDSQESLDVFRSAIEGKIGGMTVLDAVRPDELIATSAA